MNTLPVKQEKLVEDEFKEAADDEFPLPITVKEERGQESSHQNSNKELPALENKEKREDNSNLLTDSLTTFSFPVCVKKEVSETHETDLTVSKKKVKNVNTDAETNTNHKKVEEIITAKEREGNHDTTNLNSQVKSSGIPTNELPLPLIIKTETPNTSEISEKEVCNEERQVNHTDSLLQSSPEKLQNEFSEQLATEKNSQTKASASQDIHNEISLPAVVTESASLNIETTNSNANLNLQCGTQKELNCEVQSSLIVKTEPNTNNKSSEEEKKKNENANLNSFAKVCENKGRDNENSNKTNYEIEQISYKKIHIKNEPIEKLPAQNSVENVSKEKISDGDKSSREEGECDDDDEIRLFNEIDTAIDELDDVIPIEDERPIIEIESDEEIPTINDTIKTEENKIEVEENVMEIENETETRKKKKNKKKKRHKRSHSPKDIKVFESELEQTEISIPNKIEDNFPRTVFNYNHSSKPTFLRHTQLEDTLEISKTPKLETKYGSNSNLLEKVEPPPPKRIKVECDSDLDYDKKKGKINIGEVLKTCEKGVKYFKLHENNSKIFRFFYTPTKIVINNEEKYTPSPLLRCNNNIKYKFSTPNPKIDYKAFNIYNPSSNIAQICKVLGIDINNVMDPIEKNVDIIQKQNETSNDSKMKISAFDKETQTDELKCVECLKRRLGLQRHVAVEAHPQGKSIGLQTDIQKQLPLMNMLTELNANQLLAVNDFVTLMKENEWDSADSLRRYTIRESLVKLFREGQVRCETPGIQRSIRPREAPAAPPLINSNFLSFSNHSPMPVNTFHSVQNTFNHGAQNLPTIPFNRFPNIEYTIQHNTGNTR